MSAFVTDYDPKLLVVVHPLDDQPEEKCSDENLGSITMSRSVRVSLFVLRAYLMAMVGLVLYRFLQITVFVRH